MKTDSKTEIRANEIITETVGKPDSKNNSIVLVILECETFFQVYTKLKGYVHYCKGEKYNIEYFDSST